MDADRFVSHERESIGALALWIGWWMCAVYAGKKFMDAWWLDPKNRSKYCRAVQEASPLPNGHPRYTVIYRDHPSTISEMMGNTQSAQGAVAKSVCLPGITILMIGGFIMFGRSSSLSTLFVSGLRAGMPGAGLMMVVYTPVVSLAPSGALTRTTSEIEDIWVNQWVFIHFIGFFTTFFAVLLFEMPAAVARLWWMTEARVDSWPPECYYASMLLTGCQAMSALLPLPCAIAMQILPQDVDTASLKSYVAEFACLKFMAFTYMFHANTVWLKPGYSYSSLDAAILFSITVYTVWKFLWEGLYFVWLLVTWDRTDWNVWTEKEWVSRIAGGTLVDGLRKLTGRRLDFIQVVQSGVPDMKEDLSLFSMPGGGFGAKHPKVRQFLLRPKSYSAIEALDFHGLSNLDLKFFNGELAAVLHALKEPKSLYLPYGKFFKRERKLPFMRLTCQDHEAEMSRISDCTKSNCEPPKDDFDVDVIEYDITELVLKDPRAAFLATQSLEEALGAGDCQGMYELFGSLLGDPTPPFSSFFTRPGMQVLPGLSYEICIQGLRAPRPSVMLRCLKDQDVPSSLAAMPSSLLSKRPASELEAVAGGQAKKRK